MMIDRVSTSTALLAVVLLLAGCGSGDPDPNADVGTEGTQETEAPTSEETESPGEGDSDAEWEQVVAAAEEEGRVVYYSTDADETNAAVVEAFESEYDIDVEVLRLTTPPMVARLHEERGAGIKVADVLRVASAEVFESNPEYFSELTTDLLPILAEWPEDNWESIYAHTHFMPHTINYNTDMVDEADVPTTWEGVLDDRWAGEILLADPRNSPTWLGWADALRNELGEDFLTGLAELGFDTSDAAGPGTQGVAAGSHSLAFPSFSSVAIPLREEGAPLDYVIPTPIVVSTGYLGVITDAPHPNAARVLANFRLSPAGLAAACSVAEVASPMPGVEGCSEVPEEHVRIRDTWESTEAQNEVYELLGLEPVGG